MKKTITATVLSAMMALSLTSTVFAKSTFSDVPTTHWAYAKIEKAASTKMLNGYGDGTFKPDNNMTKLEFLNVIGSDFTLDAWAREFWLFRTDDEKLTFKNKITPSPVPEWADTAIDIAFHRYLINENDIEFMNLNEPISRGEIAKILSRLQVSRKWTREGTNVLLKELGHNWYTVAGEYETLADKIRVGSARSKEIMTERIDAMLNADNSEITKNIADWDIIPEEYQGYVANAYKENFINGYDDSTFKSDKLVTRAEATAMLMNFRDYINADAAHR